MIDDVYACATAAKSSVLESFGFVNSNLDKLNDNCFLIVLKKG